MSETVTRYWVDGTDPEYKSALKVVATPSDIKFTHYNKNHKNGINAEGNNYYKISIGQNFDYKTADKAEFDKFIKSI